MVDEDEDEDAVPVELELELEAAMGPLEDTVAESSSEDPPSHATQTNKRAQQAARMR